MTDPRASDYPELNIKAICGNCGHIIYLYPASKDAAPNCCYYLWGERVDIVRKLLLHNTRKHKVRGYPTATINRILKFLENDTPRRGLEI